MNRLRKERTRLRVSLLIALALVLGSLIEKSFECSQQKQALAEAQIRLIIANKGVAYYKKMYFEKLEEDIAN